MGGDIKHAFLQSSDDNLEGRMATSPLSPRFHRIRPLCLEVRSILGGFALYLLLAVAVASHTSGFCLLEISHTELFIVGKLSQFGNCFQVDAILVQDLLQDRRKEMVGDRQGRERRQGHGQDNVVRAGPG